MKLNSYVIYDAASQAYTTPVYARSDAEAKRWFTGLAQNKDDNIGKNPHDYTLHRNGLFDDNTGELIPELVECIAKAHECAANGRDTSLANLANTKPEDLQ